MRKKLFAVIMSAMMMITFMPSMAFADAHKHVDTDLTGSGLSLKNITYSADYKQAKADVVCGYDGCTVGFGNTGWIDTTRSFSDSTGLTTVTVDFTSAAQSCVPKKDGLDRTTIAVKDAATSNTYLDLKGAKIVATDGTAVNLIDADDYLDSLSIGNTVSSLAWKDTIGSAIGTAIIIVEPADLVAAGATAKKTSPIALTPIVEEGFDELKYIKNYDIDLGAGKVVKVGITPAEYTAYEETKAVDINVSFRPYHKDVLPAGFDGVINAEGYTHKLTVTADYSNWEHVTWTTKHFEGLESFVSMIAGGLLNLNPAYMYDSVKDALAAGFATGTDIDLPYIGEDFQFEIVNKNMSVEYGTWSDLGELTWNSKAPEIKNVKIEEDGYFDTYDYPMMLKLTRGSVTKYYMVKVGVDSAATSWGFLQKSFHFGVGQKVKASDIYGTRIVEDFVASVLGGSSTPKYLDGVYDSDKACFEEFANKYISLKPFDSSKAGSLDLNNSGVSLDVKELMKDILTDEELQQFYKNYGFDETDLFYGAGASGATYNTTTLTFSNEGNDITAPHQVKSFHIKKAKKLAKNKTFKLRAENDWNVEMTFKKMSGNKRIKVATNGKVTVKKGLKKGKYVVKIKVKAPGAKAATKRLTVRVVK